MTTGEKIRARRKQLGLSVDDLAAKLGKNRATIYRYESDAIEMPAAFLKPLADALDMEPGELMDWDELLVSETERSEKVCEFLPLIRSQTDFPLREESRSMSCLKHPQPVVS